MINNPLGSVQTAVAGDAQQQYLDTMNQLMQALESRAQPNLFQVAGALSKPTRTGNALEALGEGASEYGRQVAERDKLEPSLIQMKAGLAEKQLELRNKSDAMNLFGKALGVSPDEAMGVLASGNLQDNQLGGLLKSFPLIASKDPKVGAMLKDYIGMNVDQEKLIVEQKKLRNEAELFKDKTGNWPQWYQPDIFNITPKAPVGQTVEKPVVASTQGTEKTTKTPPVELSNLFGSNLKMTSGFGVRTLNGKEQMHGGIDLAPKDGKAGQSISSPVDGQIVMAGPMQGYGKAVVVKRDDGHMVLFGHVDPSVEVGAKIKQGDVVGKIGNMLGTTTGNHVEVKVIDPKGKPINPLDYKPFTSLVQKPVETQRPANEVLVASTDKYAGLSPQQVREQKAKDIESQRNIAEEEEKSNIGVSKTAKTEAMKEPQKLVDTITQKGNYGTTSYNNAQLQNLETLVKQNTDVMDLMYNKGVLSSLGAAAEKGIQTPWGSLSLPVFDAMIAGLPKEKVAAAKTIAQIIYEQNQNVMRAGKDIYGPQISNTDATQMAKAGFQPSDPSKYIVSLSQKMRLVNTWNNKISDVYDNWVEKNPNASPRQFFKSNDYRITVDNFNKTYSTFLKGIE